MHLTKRLLETKFRDADEGIKLNMYGRARSIVREWLDELLWSARAGLTRRN